jgi:hypothetical protein
VSWIDVDHVGVALVFWVSDTNVAIKLGAAFWFVAGALDMKRKEKVAKAKEKGVRTCSRLRDAGTTG